MYEKDKNNLPIGEMIWFDFDLIRFENGDLIAILNHIFSKWFDLILNHILDDFWIPSTQDFIEK
jgi:hypothetical protein